MRSERRLKPFPQVSEIAYGLLAPTGVRLRTGEGALLAIVASLLWMEHVAPRTAALRFALCALVIAQMYAHNDTVDARADLDNPRKNQRLATLLLTHGRFFRSASLVFAGLLSVTAGLALDGRAAMLAAGVMGWNAVYSRWLKAVPLVDLLAAGLWGGLFAALATTRWDLLLGVAVMTAISHVFQTLLDRNADRRAAISTTGARSIGLSLASILGLSVVLAVWALPRAGVWAASLAIVPVLAAVWIRRPSMAWLIAKAAFAALWLAVLARIA